MNPVEKKLIAHLKNKSVDYYWYGYIHRRSSCWNLKLEKDQACYRINFQTVIKGQILIKLTLLYIASYWEFEDFDANKHQYWFELNLTDLLAMSGKKTICALIFKPESPDLADVYELFKVINQKAHFLGKENEVSREKALTLAIQMI